VFIHTEPRNATRQSSSSVSAPFPLLPSLSSTLFFSKACSHTDTTAVSQTFPYQSLPHSFHRDGGGTPSLISITSLLLPFPSSRDEKAVTVSLLESALTNCDSCKFFKIRSYANSGAPLPLSSLFLLPAPRAFHNSLSFQSYFSLRELCELCPCELCVNSGLCLD
jgi:hypothetical protein